MKQKNSWIVIHHVEEGTLFWVVRALWTSDEAATYLLIPTIRVHSAHFWSHGASSKVCQSNTRWHTWGVSGPLGVEKTAGGTAVAKTCCNDCALKSSLCTPGCLTKLSIKHFTRFGRPGWLWCNGGVITAIGLAYKHHDILGFASLNLVGLLDW